MFWWKNHHWWTNHHHHHLFKKGIQCLLKNMLSLTNPHPLKRGIFLNLPVLMQLRFVVMSGIIYCSYDELNFLLFF